MEDKEYKTILVGVNLTKNGKSVVTYRYLDTDKKLPDYQKGMREGQYWSDTDKLFNSMKDENFGTVLRGVYEYVEKYDGSFVKQLKNAFDKDNKQII